MNRGWPAAYESAGLGSRFLNMRRSEDRGPIGIWASGEELRRRIASTLGKAGYELGESAADLDTLTGSRPGCKAVVASAESDPIGRISALRSHPDRVPVVMVVTSSKQAALFGSGRFRVEGVVYDHELEQTLTAS